MPDYVPGLAGVPAAESEVSFIDGQQGLLEYRGIRIEELAARSHFEETAYLLLFGRLPTASELAAFADDLRAYRRLPGAMIDVLRSFPASGHPMAVLQSAVPALGMLNGNGRDVEDEEQRVDAAKRLIAQLPAVVAGFHRLRSGQDPVEPDDDLGIAGGFLQMMKGEKPDSLHESVLDVCLILHADHTMNASTFAARVTGSTLADPYAVVSAAVGSLTGPLHGGANERVVALLESLGDAAGVESQVDAMITRKDRIMGFGHRVYKVKDPRATVLQSLAERLFGEDGATPLYRVAREVERVVVDRLGARGIHPNVDFYSGIVYRQLGFPSDLFTPIFACSRAPGWLAHWLEQLRNNRLFRPGQIYRGARGGAYVPVEERG